MAFIYPTEEQIKELIANGYEKKVFFYQIGRGEDEDDMDIYVNEEKDIAIAWDKWCECWKQTKYSELTYTNGFGLDDAEDADIKTLPEKTG